MLRTLTLCTLLLFATSAFADAIMDRIAATGTIRVGFRPGSIPFSFVDPKKGEHDGFSYDMAQLLATNLSRKFQRKISITPVTITADERFDAVLSGKIDVEMGSSTYTQQRENSVDFSLIFFISETTFLVPKNSGIMHVSDLNGKRIGAAKGTSNLASIKGLVERKALIPATIIETDTHTAGMAALVNGTIDAYCTDRSLLEGLRRNNPHPENWVILNSAIAYDPYAYILAENNSDFRDFLNNTIRWSIINGDFYLLYNKWMGPKGMIPIKMSPSLKEYLNVIAYPMDSNWMEND